MGRTQAGAAPVDTSHMAQTHQVYTLNGKFEPDTGSAGDTAESLNHFMNTSNGPLAYAIGDGTTNMVSVDYSGEQDAYTINRANVKAEAAAFVKESQDIHYSKDYLLSLAKERAAENGVTLGDDQLEHAFNQQYATRAQAIQTLAKVDKIPLTDAQTRRLQTAADGHYLDMVYARNNSESGSLYNAATARGGQKLSGAALREARQNFRDWVTVGA